MGRARPRPCSARRSALRGRPSPSRMPRRGRGWTRGRAMRGRIGISFASTVSSVIEVPATHNSGVELIWPAWTEAISSSVEANNCPPAARMNASFGWATTAGRRRHADDREHPDPDDQRLESARARPIRAARSRAGRTFTSARIAMTRGEPSGRHQDEWHEEAAEDGPESVDGEERAGLRPVAPRPARSSGAPPGRQSRARWSPAGRPGRACRTATPRVSSGCPGGCRSGRPMTPTARAARARRPGPG